MMSARALLGALTLLAAVAPLPATACSISWTRPRDPAVRYAGTDVRRVTGTYRIERIEQARNANEPVRIYGRVTTRRGTWFDVVQPYYEILVACAAYDLPMSDAAGLFYLERRARDGRYRVLGWRGQPVAGTALRPSYETGEEGQH
jgi:hypothetical protein